MPTDTPPATTRAKAELCEALTPVLTALHAELKGPAGKHPEQPASAHAREFARILADDVARLLRGEPGERYLRAVAIESETDQMSLLVALAALLAATEGFRARYFGWHADHEVTGWRIASRYGWPEIVSLTIAHKSPEATRSADKKPEPPIEDLRGELAKRLEAGRDDERYGPRPDANSLKRRRIRQRKSRPDPPPKPKPRGPRIILL